MQKWNHNLTYMRTSLLFTRLGQSILSTRPTFLYLNSQHQNQSSHGIRGFRDREALSEEEEICSRSKPVGCHPAGGQSFFMRHSCDLTAFSRRLGDRSPHSFPFLRSTSLSLSLSLSTSISVPYFEDVLLSSGLQITLFELLRSRSR